MKNWPLIFLLSLIYAALNSCSLNKPTDVDGKCSLHLIAVDTTGVYQPDAVTGIAAVDSAEVKIYSPQYNKTYYGLTDEHGKFNIEDLLASRYIISVSKLVPEYSKPDELPKNKDMLLNGLFESAIFKNQAITTDTIKLDKKILSGILINEIYYSGNNCNGTAWGDQFVELYNASDVTLFLDQLIVATTIMPANYFNDYAEAKIVYQFPGSGYDFPIAPGEFVVIAQDAINHTIEGSDFCSVDLSQAEWEFFNQYGDNDNDLVPNLENINPNKKGEFIMGLVYGGLFLIKRGKTNELTFSSTGSILFDLNDLLDGVQYSRSDDIPKIFHEKIDAGFAGIGLQKYTGMSIERENPLTGEAGYDTDNSAVDFVINSSPTPGFQHKKN